MWSGIKPNEIILVISFYLFMMINYHFVLYIDTGVSISIQTTVINYVYKGLLTLPLWWLIFRFLSPKPFWKKLLIHMITLPLFVFIWVQTYYWTCEQLDLFYLTGSRQVWGYYLTGLFYIIQFGNFHVYDYYKKLRKQQLATAELGQLAVQSELSALKAQLNPHFLYNVFNTINAAIPAQAEKTRNMVAKLSDLFRYQLKASKEDLVTLEEEVDFVKKYLALEKERFGERLHYQFDINPDNKNLLLPPILIQPIVENAIKHGISPLISGGTLNLSVNTVEDELCFIISDTGIGLKNQSHEEVLNKGIGLSNTHKRLIRLYGKGLELVEKTDSGLEIRFSIPIMDKK